MVASGAVLQQKTTVLVGIRRCVSLRLRVMVVGVSLLRSSVLATFAAGASSLSCIKRAAAEAFLFELHREPDK